MFDFDAIDEMLLCPKSKSKLILDENRLISIDPGCRLAYNILDGIPVMLVDDAVELSPEEWKELMAKHGRDTETGKALN